MPGYKREQQSTVHYTNRIVRVSLSGGKKYLKFPDKGPVICIGKDYCCASIVKVEVKPYNQGFKLLVTYDAVNPEVSAPANPKRILGLDAGVTNFLAGVTNFDHAPFLVDGRWIKAENQYFNKKRAKLLSELAKGTDSVHSVKNSKRLSALSRKRDQKFRVFFYKTAHWLSRVCVSMQIDVVVCTHNPGQKQGVNTGRINNQNFVQIPYATFFEILKRVAAEYGIPVILREESYTSKASLVDGDMIPTFGDEPGQPYQFSGKRIKRGAYQTKSGMIINADLNGAGNVIRKEYPDAFADIEDWSFLNHTIIVITRDQLCHGLRQKWRKPVSVVPHKSVSRDRYTKHDDRWGKKQDYMELFGVTKKAKREYLAA